MKTNVLVVGASVAGVAVAEQLARHSPHLAVMVVSGEAEWPYDKPPLSKQMLRDPDGGTRPLLDGEPAFDLVLGDRAVEIDEPSRRVVLRSGAVIAYEWLVIATGATARVPSWAGPDVSVLREAGDAREIHRRARDSESVTIVGGGLVGSEVAAVLRAQGRDVRLVHAMPLLADRALGRDLAGELTNLHQSRGVCLRVGRVAEVESTGASSTVRLRDGESWRSDLVIAAVGVVPASGLVASGARDGAGAVRCDAVGRVVGSPSLFALGDVSAWAHPDDGTHRSHRHWTNAVEQARVVAAEIGGASPAPPPAERVRLDRPVRCAVREDRPRRGAGRA